MEFVEVSAKTVDEAITKACIELEASSDRLEIQVISEGSSGFLGFGSKPAVIKVRKKEEPAWDMEEPEEAKAPVKEEPKPKAEIRERRNRKRERKPPAESPGKRLPPPGRRLRFQKQRKRS